MVQAYFGKPASTFVPGGAHVAVYVVPVTVHVRTEVVAKRASRSRPGNGILTLEHSGYNQKDVLVAICRRNALMLCKERG
jgi:acyl dehydratase